MLLRPHQPTLLRPGQELPRDPLSIGITAITAFEALTAVSIGFEIAATVGTVIIAGTLVAANYALSVAMAEDGPAAARGPSGINGPDARGTIRMATAPQRIIYGRILTGGVWYFYDDSDPPFQYVGMMLCRGRITRVRALMINKRRVPFDLGSTFNDILTPIAVEGQDYSDTNVFRACFRQGLADQAKDALLDLDFPVHVDTPLEIVKDDENNVTNLPASFRQQGIATATFRARFGNDREEFEARWGQVAFINPLVECDGRPIYDPRDPTQDIDDESTYKFDYNGREVGRNASLIVGDWLRQPFGGRLRNDQIRLDELADSANFDDEVVYDRDGNARPRHQADGVVLLNENPKHITEAMLTACRAWIVQSRGRVGWVPARPVDPAVTITERDFLGGFDFQYGASKSEMFNRIKTRFPSVEKDYAEEEGPILDRADLRLDEDGDELLENTARLGFTVDHRAVQWLGSQFLEESRLARRLEIPNIPIRPRFLKMKIGDVVRVQHRRYPEIDGVYQIVQDGFSGDFSMLSWSLKEYDKTILSRDRSADEQEFKVSEA